MKKSLMAWTAAALMGAAALPSHAYAWGIDWNDWYISYRHVWNDKQPGNAKNAQEDALNLSYANGWTYGSNFVNIDFENFTVADSANSVFPTYKPADSSEVYAIFRTTFSANKISGTKMFSFGPIADVGLEIGGDYDTQNDAFASYKKLFVVGPQIAIALPKGFWTITFAASHEWDTNGFSSATSPYIGTATNYGWAPMFETAWLYPFNIGPVPMQFTGFANIIGGKGYGNSGDSPHSTEILLHPKLLIDVGSLVNYAPNKIFAGVGYEYWHNKFGNVPVKRGGVPGTEQNAVFAEIGYHW